MRQLTARRRTRSSGATYPSRASKATQRPSFVRSVVARCDIDLFLTSGFVPLRGPFALGHEAVAEIDRVLLDIPIAAYS
jgi:hypothetical protein